MIKAEAPNPRAEGVRALQRFLPLPADDGEARAERRLLRRLDLRQAIQAGTLS